jgi:CRISPR/Cas system-associated exonuclease Cas4 (RecB family)
MKSKVVLMEGVTDIDAEYKRLVAEAEIEESALQLPKGFLSVSQVNSYLRCPRTYYFRYIKNVIRPPGARQTEGSAVHKTLELAHKTKKETKKAVELDTMLDAYHQAWQDLKVDIEFDDQDDKEDDIVKRDVKFITKYHKEFIPNIDPQQIELKFFIPLTSLRIPILGYIDLIDGGEEDKIPTVVDHKVVEKSKTQHDADTALQLTLYAHATGLSKARFDMFVKTKEPKIVTLRTTRTTNHVRWAETVFEEVAQAISKGIFPPCAPDSYTCTPRWCGYYDMCHALKKGI